MDTGASGDSETPVDSPAPGVPNVGSNSPESEPCILSIGQEDCRLQLGMRLQLRQWWWSQWNLRCGESRWHRCNVGWEESRHSVQSVRLNRGGRGGRGVGVLWVSDVRFQYDCNELLLLSHEV